MLIPLDLRVFVVIVKAPTDCDYSYLMILNARHIMRDGYLTNGKKTHIMRSSKKQPAVHLYCCRISSRKSFLVKFHAVFLLVYCDAVEIIL